MNHKFTYELTHLASADYDSLLDKDCIEEDVLTSDCGSLTEHLKLNSCPKKHGEIGDCHYELYVQQEVIIDKDSEEEAYKKLTIYNELKKHLDKNKVKEFSPEDFEIEMIYDEDTNEPIGLSKMKIVHEKLYYNNEVEIQ